MNMLRSLNQLNGYDVRAVDGDMGKVSEFVFDDFSWVVRYLVVDLGKSHKGRTVLISPVAMLQPIWAERMFPVSVTRRHVEESPDINTDEPIERQQEEEVHRHYAWEYYWTAEIPMRVPQLGMPYLTGKEQQIKDSGSSTDKHLHTTRLVTGYHIQTIDGTIGHVTDFIVDDFSWTVRYLVVATHDLLPGKHVLIVPEQIRAMSWEEKKVFLNITREKVQNSPLYDPADPVNRGHEELLCDYYGRPRYWLTETTDEEHGHFQKI